MHSLNIKERNSMEGSHPLDMLAQLNGSNQPVVTNNNTEVREENPFARICTDDPVTMYMPSSLTQGADARGIEELSQDEKSEKKTTFLLLKLEAYDGAYQTMPCDNSCCSVEEKKAKAQDIAKCFEELSKNLMTTKTVTIIKSRLGLLQEHGNREEILISLAKQMGESIAYINNTALVSFIDQVIGTMAMPQAASNFKIKFAETLLKAILERESLSKVRDILRQIMQAIPTPAVTEEKDESSKAVLNGYVNMWDNAIITPCSSKSSISDWHEVLHNIKDYCGPAGCHSALLEAVMRKYQVALDAQLQSLDRK